MRITNSIMNRNTKTNININKVNEDKLNTQMATGQKITRPSDDPVIAIRALRLNSNMEELNQYYDKNIPDAEAWLKITETALSQTNSVLTNIKESITQGASDDNNATDRQKILDNMSAMRDQIYAAGNADYANRTVFTGYRTGENLTFLEDTTYAAGDGYTDIKEKFSIDDIETINYISGTVDVDADLTVTNTEYDIKENDVYRIRLAYDNIDNGSYSIKYTPSGSSSETTLNLTTKSIAGLSQSQIDAVYTGVGANDGYIIPETGEVILGSALRDTLLTSSNISVSYDKSEFNKNDLRPEHYFSCKLGGVNYETPGSEQDLKIEISFNQTININSHADDAFSPSICRDVDELIKATQDVVDAENKVKRLEEMAKDTTKYSSAQIDTINDMITAATKEYDLLNEKMQNMFSEAETRFDKYLNDVNDEIARVGSLSKRLSLTKSRVGDQVQSMKELQDDNININLTDTAIDLSNAELALQAAQMAASKIAQQTLLNYL